MVKLFLALLFLQTTQAPVFEVASIKPSTADPNSSASIATEKGRLTGRNVTLKRCIRSAYDIPESRIFGGPKWVEEDRYDIDAKAAGPSGDHDMQPMLQALLADRFKLTFHRETRTIGGWALVAGKKGITAKASAPNIGSRGSSSNRMIDVAGCDMACLARKLSEVLHQPVADASGIEGRFDFKLEFVPENLNAKTPSAADVQGPTVFAALEEQLGLKLEPRKVPTEVLVIDRAEKASEN